MGGGSGEAQEEERRLRRGSPRFGGWRERGRRLLCFEENAKNIKETHKEKSGEVEVGQAGVGSKFVSLKVKATPQKKLAYPPDGSLVNIVAASVPHVGPAVLVESLHGYIVDVIKEMLFLFFNSPDDLLLQVKQRFNSTGDQNEPVLSIQKTKKRVLCDITRLPFLRFTHPPLHSIEI